MCWRHLQTARTDQHLNGSPQGTIVEIEPSRRQGAHEGRPKKSKGLRRGPRPGSKSQGLPEPKPTSRLESSRTAPAPEPPDPRPRGVSCGPRRSEIAPYEQGRSEVELRRGIAPTAAPSRPEIHPQGTCAANSPRLHPFFWHPRSAASANCVPIRVAISQRLTNCRERVERVLAVRSANPGGRCA